MISKILHSHDYQDRSWRRFGKVYTLENNWEAEQLLSDYLIPAAKDLEIKITPASWFASDFYQLSDQLENNEIWPRVWGGGGGCGNTLRVLLFRENVTPLPCHATIPIALLTKYSNQF